MTSDAVRPRVACGSSFAETAIVCRDAVENLRASRPGHDVVVVGIDGPDCSGKSTLADAVADLVTSPVMTLRFDDDVQVHDEGIVSLPGPHSFIELFPPDRLIERVRATAVAAPARSVIVVEGLFLLQHALASAFQWTVRLEVAESTVIRRALQRDTVRFGTPAAVTSHYRRHCLPAQSAYRLLCRPSERADLLVDADQW